MKITGGRSYTHENPRNPAMSGTFTSAPASSAGFGRDTKGDVRAFHRLLFKNWDAQTEAVAAAAAEAERTRQAHQAANDELRAAFKQQRG